MVKVNIPTTKDDLKKIGKNVAKHEKRARNAATAVQPYVGVIALIILAIVIFS